jgi:PAS domain S-box-containing protein
MSESPLLVDHPAVSEPLFRALIEHGWDSISLVSTDARYSYVSPATSRILGFAEHELVGRNVFDLMHPDDRQHTLDLFAELLRKPGGSVTAQLRYRHQTGSWKWLDCIGTNLIAEPAVRAIVVNFRDITDRKSVEEALRESSQLNKQLIASVHEGIVVYDRDFRYVLFNPYMEEATGLKSEEVMGKHPWELFPFLREIGMEEWLPNVLAGEMVTCPDIAYRIPHSGKSGWTSGQFSPLRNAAGEIIGVIGTVRDITARKQEEEQRRQLETQIQHTQKLESLGVLAGGVAHDFNNLLTGVLGNASLALQALPVGSALYETIADIQTAALRAAELTKQMLAYAGKGPFVVQAVLISGIVKEMATLLQSVISRKAVLRFDFSGEVAPIEADVTQIRQIVMNLITNASEALNGNNGIITLRTRMIQLNSETATTFFPCDLPSGRYVSLEVADSGLGMDEATKTRIFEPFFTTKFTGRGLGLSAVLGVVRGHHGAIKIISEVGHGTTMQVLWPPLEKPVPEVPKQTTSSAGWRGEGTILVIDDEPMTRMLAKKILEMVGFRVLQAQDGPEGIEMFLQHRPEIVAVLLDLVMPNKNGDEVFRELRAHSPAVPIVLVSGFHAGGVSDLFRGTIPAVFVEKPFEPEALIDAVREAVTWPAS